MAADMDALVVQSEFTFIIAVLSEFAYYELAILMLMFTTEGALEKSQRRNQKQINRQFQVFSWCFKSVTKFVFDWYFNFAGYDHISGPFVQITIPIVAEYDLVSTARKKTSGEDDRSLANWGIVFSAFTLGMILVVSFFAAMPY